MCTVSLYTIQSSSIKLMSGSVHVKEAVLVMPSEPTPNQILHLSVLDSQLFVRFTFEYLFAYRPNNGIDKAAVTRNVRLALAKALVPYYPLAGRVRNRTDGLQGLEVDCRAQGALFLEAESTDSKLSEFENAPSRVAQWRKFLSLYVEDVLKGAPPLVVQLTWLSDGGATLGVGFNHCLCDGMGSGEFLNSFSELSSGKMGVLEELKTRSIWSRHLLDTKSLIRDDDDDDQQPICHQAGKHPEFDMVPDVSKFSLHFTRERLIPTCVTFERTRINELKKLIKYPCTSFEAIAAHVWRSWTKALNLPGNQILKLLFSINIRQRMNPRLPRGYYGNAFVLGCAQACVEDLTENGLGFAIELVRKAKERVGDEYIREVVDLVSLNGASARVDSVGVLIMTQWMMLGLENVDFGIGRPVNIGPVCCDKYCILLPVPDQTDAVKINLAMPASAVDEYLCLLDSPKCRF